MKIQSSLAGIKVGEGHPVRIMGVINASPESFYQGSVKTDHVALAAAAQKMTAEGADFIDVGAMSTAPYLKTQVPEKEEARRLADAVRIIKQNTDLPISIDTSRARPAEEGLAAGARIINDITGLSGDPAMAKVAKQAEGLVLMAHPQASNGRALKIPIADTKKILQSILKTAAANGIARSKIVLDPGIGFFRTTALDWWQWDVAVLRDLAKLKSLRAPLLIGVSRKSFIGKLLGGKAPEDRLAGSLGATLVAVANGAALVRTHDVLATREAVRVAEASGL